MFSAMQRINQFMNPRPPVIPSEVRWDWGGFGESKYVPSEEVRLEV